MHKENKKKPQRVQRKTVIIKMKEGLSIEHPHAAGIDVGDTEFSVAFRNKAGGYEVRTYGTFTQDLDCIVKDLKEFDIETVSIESTGVYYVSLYLKIEAAGIEPYLVNARHAKNVTGRKHDDSDAIWLQKLHTCGLLQKSFQPADNARAFRDLVRQRRKLVIGGSDQVRRMQRALELMNVKIHTVISDLLGKTGMSIVKAIIGGEQDATKLAALRDNRIKAPVEVIVMSLEGVWRNEHVFVLKQSLEAYEFYQKQIGECDEKIKEQLNKMTAIVLDGEIYNDSEKVASVEDSKPAKAPKTKKKAVKNQFRFDVRSHMAKVLGTDLCELEGVSDITVLELIAEIGTDISQWKNEKRFNGWLNLCPNTKISGGKVISSRVMKKKNHAGLTLRMAAMTVARSKTPLGDYYRRMRGKLGGKGAVVATANKMAKIIYQMLKEKKPYDKTMLEKATDKNNTKQIAYHERMLAQYKKTA
ncbi:MAG: IS110 family transposase [Ferruginibacter sp.]